MLWRVKGLCCCRKRKQTITSLFCTGFLILVLTSVIISCFGVLFVSNSGTVYHSLQHTGYLKTKPLRWKSPNVQHGSNSTARNVFWNRVVNNGNTTESTTKQSAITIHSYFEKSEIESIKNITSRNLITNRLLGSTRKLCHGSVIFFGSGLVEFHNITIYSKYASHVRGGEKLESVLGQKENLEYLSVKKGFFRLPTCSYMDVRQAVTISDKYVKPWVGTIKPEQNLSNIDNIRYDGKRLFVTIIRNEYANLYWTMIDIYDIYFLSHVFLVRPEYVTVILMDAHPQGLLDPLWVLVFGNVLRFKDLPQAVTFERLIWSMHRSRGPLANLASGVQRKVPFLDELKRAVHKKLRLESVSVREKCQTNSSFNILFVLRRDYVAHARNPSGKIKRKISNEKEILKSVSEAFPLHRVSGLQLDTVSIDNQIRHIFSTEILIGVHGAGLTHVIFQQVGRALIEIFPSAYGTYKNDHFEYLARWSGVHYLNYHSVSKRFQDRSAEFIQLQPRSVILLIKNAIDTICNAAPM